MKIQSTELNKNFWGVPFWISFIISFFVYYFGNSYFSYLSIKTITENTQPYSDFLFFGLFSSPFTIILVLITVYFITRRLLGERPQKVFYLELPILIIIYSLFSSINILFGLMIGGAADLTSSHVKNLVLFPILFKIIWLILLTISLYYYKQKLQSRNNA